MKRFTLFVIFGLVLSQGLSVPLPQISSDKSGYKPQDWVSDLIQLITGKDVTVFITLIDATINQVEVLVKESDQELRSILETLPNGPPRKEIEAVLNEAINEALFKCKPVINDLRKLMPAITGNREALADVSVIIQIILGKSLEIFLAEVLVAFMSVDKIIVDTIGRLSKVADEVAKEAAVRINAVLKEKFEEARHLFGPVIRVLEQLGLTVDIHQKTLNPSRS